MSESVSLLSNTNINLPVDVGTEATFASLDETPVQAASLASNVMSSHQGQATAPSTLATGSIVNPNALSPVQTQIASRFQCGQCNQAFKRDGDRSRHERSIHRANYGLFVCPITGCPRSQGVGYSRADKVTAHLWKKHGDLGYVKGV